MSGTISGDFHSAELAGNGACVNTIGQTMSPGTLVRMSIGGLSLYLLIHAVVLLYAAVGRVKGNNQLTHLAIWGPRVPSHLHHVCVRAHCSTLSCPLDERHAH